MPRQSRLPSASPFFAPSTPRVLRPVSTPGGTFVRLEKKEVDKESKSSIFGTSGNLVNAIVGAGIVGIPYAMKECGLGSGILMVIFCAFLTDKSLRLLIETAKHIDVPSYEVLAEASFGFFGFYFISINMFIMAYGAMISYLIIIKDTIPILFGVSMENIPVRRAILVLSSLLIIFPLSCQRDMADLAKTSTISVIFDILMVGIVSMKAPIKDTIYDLQSTEDLLKRSFLQPKTFFIGIGVLSFAFVCQHSGFIIAGSLENPTKKRWSKVTGSALFVCGLLASIIGFVGYAAYGEDTQGNILNNFSSSGSSYAANVARGLLGTTMFFVYPMESFVARHVFVVIFFQGRRAHEGDDHAVLARLDRRVGVTLFLYLTALMPAIIFEDLGSVLSVTGAIGGSSLSYIGPGAVYLAVHGKDILKLINDKWPHYTLGLNLNNDEEEGVTNENGRKYQPSIFSSTLSCLTWYVFLMPLWHRICLIGCSQLEDFKESEALKSPHPNRLGQVKHQHRLNMHKKIMEINKISEDRPLLKPPERRGSFSDGIPNNGMDIVINSPYGATGPVGGKSRTAMTNKDIARKIAEINRLRAADSNESSEEKTLEDDPQDNAPNWGDVVVAIGFIMFGVLALIVGLVSIYVGGD